MIKAFRSAFVLDLYYNRYSSMVPEIKYLYFSSEQFSDKSPSGCSDTARALDSSGMDNLPTPARHIHGQGDKSVDAISSTAYRAGYDILNEFFRQPAICPGPASDVEGAGKHRD